VKKIIKRRSGKWVNVRKLGERRRKKRERKIDYGKQKGKINTK
jgi:hypothetical protein